MLYFGYASNLDPVQMSQRCPGHAVVGLAELREHRLTFPRTSGTWGGGTASVIAAHGESVWGVVFQVTDAHLAALDSFEGCKGPGHEGNLYDRALVTVELVRADDGSFARKLRAWCYVAVPATPSPPSRRYLDAILRGARHHRLPSEYVARLAATPTAD
jgi:gamma-glutamylcyclotransferase (GGCT)/AIG2-like uncharacterized protein YtfP